VCDIVKPRSYDLAIYLRSQVPSDIITVLFLHWLHVRPSLDSLHLRQWIGQAPQSSVLST